MAVKQINYRTFLEDVDLFEAHQITDISNTPPRTIRRFCTECSEKLPHHSAQHRASLQRLGAAMVPDASVFREGTPEPIEETDIQVEDESPTYQEGTGLLFYLCADCDEEVSIAVHYDGPRMTKFGEWPSKHPEVPDELKSYLTPSDQENYKRGLISEKHGFGIGAAAYYRRMVEDLIFELLREIEEFLMDDDELREVYHEKLQSVAHSHRASDKIEVVKDCLPSALRPGGENPLAKLYRTLSDGIHNLTDEAALQQAKAIRVTLSFVITKVSEGKRDQEEYAHALRQLDV